LSSQFASFIDFLLNLGRCYEIWEILPLFGQARKYFYRASVGLCGQEIGQLAAVDSTVSKAGQDLSAQSPPKGKKYNHSSKPNFTLAPEIFNFSQSKSLLINNSHFVIFCYIQISKP
jgi:hypothetical protein